MRLLAFDIGDKRTGLAVGDIASGIVSPVGVVEGALRHRRSSDERGVRFAFDAAHLTRQLVAVIREHEPDVVVVGVPFNMDGSVGVRAELVSAYAEHLRAAAEAAGVRVRFDTFDERLTSAEADWQMARSGLTHKQKKQRRDALAAAAILRGYLASKAE
jgi:putative Holliday junction resolvase